MKPSRPVYRERIAKRTKGPVVCSGCGQQIKRPMRYYYRQVAYKATDGEALEWSDEYLHFACRWLVYALWNGLGQEPSLSPWIPPLIKAVGEESLRAIEHSTKKTHIEGGEDEDIPGFDALSNEDQARLLKWTRGTRFRKPERIRRLWIKKQMYPFAAEPPWTATEWLRIYAPNFASGGFNEQLNNDLDRTGREEENADHVPGETPGVEGRGVGRQEAVVAAG